MKITKHIVVLLYFAFVSFQAGAQQAKPSYKDANMPVSFRVNDLLKRMTVAEKVGQLSTLMGWEMYTRNGEEVSASLKLKVAIADAHIGGLWAMLRADPWTQKTIKNGLNPVLSAKAVNAVQKYAIENSRLGIPLLLAEECPHGHMAIGTTVFPTSIGQASTWNPKLIKQMAAAIARETRAQGATIGYGPVLDLAREPRWSRVEETYGEDPVLIARMGEAVVSGFQGAKLNAKTSVISTLKHFAAYGAPEGGLNSGPISVGDRELQQSYFLPFKAAVKAGALSVMSAYNAVDGIPNSSNRYLLTDLLKKSWGLKGFTVSDLYAISGLVSQHQVAANAPEAAALAINAGLDVDLSGDGFGKALLAAIKKGLVSTAVLDSAVSRVLAQKFNLGLFENPYADEKLAEQTVRSAENIALSYEVAKESLTLLKNSNNALPLAKTLKRIAVIGPNAANVYNQLGDYTAPQADGAVKTILDGLKNKMKSAQVTYVKGCAIIDTTTADIAAAVQAAKKAEVAIVVLGGSSARDFRTTYETTGAAKVAGAKEEISDMESGEGYDRASLDLMGKQLQLLKEVVKTGTPVILVVIAGRPLNLNWADANVPAILQAWYPGQEGGAAVADVLFGDYNPAGRLPISIPKSVGQLPIYYNNLKPERKKYIDDDAKPLYPFGYGLSYTNFEYSDLSLSSTESKGRIKVNIQFTLRNTGKLKGDEVVQVYVRDLVSSTVTPVIQLKKFMRVNLEAGQEEQIKLTLDEQDLSLYNQKMKQVVEAGAFEICIGPASNNFPLKTKLMINKSIPVN